MLLKMLQKSFTAKLWETFFRFIRDYHPHQILFKILKKLLKAKEDEQCYALIDVWIHFHLLLAVIIWLAFGIVDQVTWLMWFFVIYGILRISFVVIYNMNAILFDPFRHNCSKGPYMVRSFRRVLICVFINYVEILLWFAIFYRLFKHRFCMFNVCLNNLWGSLYFSVVTMTTLGYGDIKPIDNCGAFMCLFQTLIGVFWVVVVIARFISVFPKTKSRDPAEI